MTLSTRLAIAGGTTATLTAGIAAVWLTEDARAFGIVVMLAGVVVGVAVGRNEWRVHAPHRKA